MTSKSGEGKATEGREQDRERWSVLRKAEIALEVDLGGIEASPDRDHAVYRILKESLAT